MGRVSASPSVAALRARLDELTIRDADRLRRRLDGQQRKPNPAALTQIADQITAAAQRITTRMLAVPEITYPDLPVSAKRDDIAAAIREHQVVVVAGETGSGKTTQLPKICLELGRGIRGTIGHTQPRRIAARTVAQRIADELHTDLGDAVGYTVRFTDQASDRTLVKLMTDGILLAEMQRDRRLLRYDTLILDEAHERSLNIDFLLGYLRQLLPRRLDLKVIVTSATIEPGRFAEHFASAAGGAAPIVEVSGRTYPVEVRYRPLEPDVSADETSDDAGDADDPDHDVTHRVEARDQTEAIVDAIHELEHEPPGDVLVFLSGEREIRDTAEALKDLRNTEVLPLYARLSTAEQQRVFETSHTGRRVVLATNVAETSLTVPGIRYVVDPGTARISRYSRRTKVQRLPIEPISQASAAQRAGRCGRVADGVCIRLYSETDFELRPRYTDPEILRTNLASVMLQMAALHLGEVAAFPFLDPPDRRSIRDGSMLLQELGAFDADAAITDIGRRLAQLPVDPRIGRMILAADTENCVREVLVLAAALSIPDPRERPADREDAAKQKHARFADEHSDFVSYLNLWRYLREQRQERSGNQFRRMCREEFLHYLRIREWQDLVGQLRSIAKSLNIVESSADEPAGADAVHAALLAGLLSHVGKREGDNRDYVGARNTKFVLAPGSVLTKRPPRWVVVADLVETTRLYGRIAARIDPESVERVAGDLVQRTYSEPHWDAQRGAAMAYERVTLFGLPLVPRRRVGYSTVEPEESRELFLRHALVEGDWSTRHHFFRDNEALRAELEEMEEKARRRDLLVGDDEIYAFYDARVPAEAVSQQHFDAWWKKTRHATPNLLTMTREDLLQKDDDAPETLETWQSDDLALPVTYRFEPGAEDDGVTVHIPVDVLARLGREDFAWQVPALREELVIALLRALPKELRRVFVPVPDTARAVLAELTPGQEPLLAGLQRALRERTGVLVPIEAFDLAKVPAHLRVTFAVEDAGGELVAQGKDLNALQEQLAAPVRAAVAAAVAGELERSGLTEWPADLVELPRSVERTSGAHTVHGYPALVDEGVSVAVRVFPTAAEQQAAMRLGTRRLLRLVTSSPAKAVERTLATRARLVLGTNPDGSLAALIDDAADAAVDVLAAEPAWTADNFAILRKTVTEGLVARTTDVVRRVERVLSAAHDVRLALPADPPKAQADAIADIRDQFRRLLPVGFVAQIGAGHLADAARYVTAISRRLELLPRDVEVDRGRMLRVHTVRDVYDELVRSLPSVRAGAEDIRDIGRLVEELRVSLWAQQLGTARPVSEKRIFRAIDAIEL
ncbi:MAG: ATP-dependent RNA helicase HrpA [Jatrophihabitans sp.]